jgi:hypothetical protein
MLKDLLARHRALSIGASLVGASVLAVGFASPAFATGSLTGPTGGNAPSQNYNIIEGGSETTYTMMTQLSNLFNEAPGCDLVPNGGTKPLDYGCAGVVGVDSGTGGAPGTNVTTTASATTNSGSKNVTIGTTLPTGVASGEAFTDADGAFAGGATISKITPPVSPAVDYVLKVSESAASSNTGDTLTIVTTPAVGENGLAPFNQENPFNDVLVEEPAIGSSSGVSELEDQATDAPAAWNGSTSASSGNNVSPLDAARSSRAASTASGGDSAGLNFVAYAQDGVSWLHWTTVGTTATPSSSITSLSTAQLASIYNGTLSCTDPFTSATVTDNWGCLNGGATAADFAPIDVYWAQTSSGTYTTWYTMLGLVKNDTYGAPANHIIFENETSSITRNGDMADAIFFFSYGKFKTTCTPASGYCGSEPTGWNGGSIKLGEISANGGPAVPVNKCTISLQLPGATSCTNNGTTYSVAADQVFPGDRLLYNVYSDGSNARIPESSNATLNAISEDGFMCKPSTSADVDPSTGATYLTEIDAVIKAQGFYPLPLLKEGGSGTINTPAWSALTGSKYTPAVEEASPYNSPAADTDTDISAVSGSYTGVLGAATPTTPVAASPTAPVGYCLVSSTDGDGNN